MKKLLPLFLVFAAHSAMADMGVPSYIGSTQDKAKLETAIKEQKWATASSVKSVECSNVIVVRTGGTLNTATAAGCVIDGEEFMLVCKNNMTGTIGSSVRLHPDQTLESELRSLIADQCVGG